MGKIVLRYVAMSPIEIELLNPDGSSLLTETGERVTKIYQVGEEVDVGGWRPSKVSSMVEYRRLLPVAADSSGTVIPAQHAGEPGLGPTILGSPAPTTVTRYEDERHEPVYPRYFGGPYYELSNGVRVKGRKAAEAAEALLK